MTDSNFDELFNDDLELLSIIQEIDNMDVEDKKPVIRPKVIPALSVKQALKDLREPEKKKKIQRWSFFSNLFFYGGILLMLISVVMFGSRNANGRTIFGYSFIVLNENSGIDVKAEYSRSALLLVKKQPDQDIQIGNNIFFKKDAFTNMLDRVIAIYENYDGTGVRAFVTKSMEQSMDGAGDAVNAPYVTGVVKGTIPILGGGLYYIGNNIHVIFPVFVLCLLFIFILHEFSGKSKVGRVSQF